MCPSSCTATGTASGWCPSAAACAGQATSRWKTGPSAEVTASVLASGAHFAAAVGSADVCAWDFQLWSAHPSLAEALP